MSKSDISSIKSELASESIKRLREQFAADRELIGNRALSFSLLESFKKLLTLGDLYGELTVIRDHYHDFEYEMFEYILSQLSYRLSNEEETLPFDE